MGDESAAVAAIAAVATAAAVESSSDCGARRTAGKGVPKKKRQTLCDKRVDFAEGKKRCVEKESFLQHYRPHKKQPGPLG